MRAIAVIPARDGSARLPGKNMLSVGGRTLVERAMECAFAADCAVRADRLVRVDVVVTSDSDDVLDVAGERGYQICNAHRRSTWAYYLVTRPPHLSTATSEIEPAIAHAIGEVGAEEFDAVVLLQPTSPLRRPEHVRLALQRLEEGYDSACSVTQFPHLYFGGRLRSDATRFQPDRALHVRRRTQDLGHYCYENGAVYATTMAAWRTSGMRMSGKIGAVVMPWEDSVDIDTQADLDLARWLYSRRTEAA